MLNVLCSSDGEHSCDPDLAVHVEHCADCQQALERLARNGFSTGTGTRASDLMPARGELPEFEGFVVERELDRGGMGVVYLARQLVPGRLVAIKCVARGPLGTLKERRRWLREAEMASKVRHPNVVTVYGVLEAADSLLLILEYIPGGSLARRLAGPLAPRDAAGLVEKIARAVHHIHVNKLLHLDLKPSNILLDSSSGDGTSWDALVPKISDFGIAIHTDRSTTRTESGHLGGTPAYMAPEQVAGSAEQLGPAVDIHALGAILYELLTGRQPFLADSDIETLLQIQKHDPVPPRRLNPKVPLDLQTICLKCLRKDPNRRYASAEALAEDLGRWIEGRPILARPVHPLEKTWRWCRRRPAASSLAAGLVVTVPAGFLCFLLLWRSAEAERARADAERVKSAADYEVSRSALAEIVDIGAASLEPTVVFTRDRAIASLLSARPRIAQLHQRRPDDPANWSLLASVDLFLGRNFEYQKRWGEAEACFEESLMHWGKVVARSPTEFAPACRRWQTLVCLGRVLEQQGKEAESIECFERAIATGISVRPMLPDPEFDFGTLMDCRMNLAKMVEDHGDQQRAGSLLEANVRLWQSMPEAAKIPATAARMQQCWGELVRIQCESETVGPEEWAQRALDVLRSLRRPDDGDRTDLPEFGYLLQLSLTESASSFRRSGNVARAGRIVERMHCLGRLLVSKYPDRSAAHLAYCKAFIQSAKDGFQAEDLAAVERNWTRGLNESRQALVVDPQDARSQKEVVGLEQKLRQLAGSHQKLGFR
jgi:hypothetical protein